MQVIVIEKLYWEWLLGEQLTEFEFQEKVGLCPHWLSCIFVFGSVTLLLLSLEVFLHALPFKKRPNPDW